MKKLMSVIMMSVGTILVAAEVHFFEVPNRFAIGGVSGIGILLSKMDFIPISAETWIVILDILLLIIGFILKKGNVYTLSRERMRHPHDLLFAPLCRRTQASRVAASRHGAFDGPARP